MAKALNLTRSRESYASAYKIFLAENRERVYRKYKRLEGTIVRGLVQRIINGAVYVVFEDGNEAVLPRGCGCRLWSEEHYAINDYVDAELVAVWKTTRGPALILSRARRSFIESVIESLYG